MHVHASACIRVRLHASVCICVWLCVGQLCAKFEAGRFNKFVVFFRVDSLGSNLIEFWVNLFILLKVRILSRLSCHRPVLFLWLSVRDSQIFATVSVYVGR